MTQERDEGIIRKWAVTRIDDMLGKHDGCFLMVMDPAHDPHAMEVLKSYAIRVMLDGYYQLAEELMTKLKEIEERQSGKEQKDS